MYEEIHGSGGNTSINEDYPRTKNTGKYSKWYWCKLDLANLFSFSYLMPLVPLAYWCLFSFCTFLSNIMMGTNICIFKQMFLFFLRLIYLISFIDRYMEKPFHLLQEAFFLSF